jgi:molybdopterin molybdotransferase
MCILTIVRVDQKRYLKLTPVASALEALLGEVGFPKVEVVPTVESLDRFSAEDYAAKWDVPRFDVAAMDGYAVRALDLPDEGSAKLFNVRGRLSPNSADTGSLGKGDAYYVATGSPLPPGADTVVRVEETRFVDGDKVSIGVKLERGKNVSQRGEDLRRGEVVVRRGERITPNSLSLLVYFGVRHVRVYRKPRVGVLSIGSELVDFEKSKRGGGVYNNYAYLITSYLKRLGLEPRRLGVVEDDAEAITKVVRRVLNGLDVLITIGGTSVGLWDNTPDAVSEIPGSRVLFHGLRVVPLKPTGAACVEGGGGKSFIVLLPAQVVSAALSFHEVCVPLLSSLSGGGPEAFRSTVNGFLVRSVENPRSIEALYLVELRMENGDLLVSPLGWGSNLMSNLLRAKGFIRLRPKQALEAGSRVTAELLGSYGLLC